MGDESVLSLPVTPINYRFHKTTQHHLGCCRHNKGGLQHNISSPKPCRPTHRHLITTTNRPDNSFLHLRDPQYPCASTNNDLRRQPARPAHEQHNRDATDLVLSTSRRPNRPTKREAGYNRSLRVRIVSKYGEQQREGELFCFVVITAPRTPLFHK